MEKIFESLNEEIDLFKKNQVVVVEEKADEPNEEAGDAETPPQANSAGLVSGYGSSSEEEEEEEEPENDDAGIIDDLNQIDSGDVNERGPVFPAVRQVRARQVLHVVVAMQENRKRSGFLQGWRCRGPREPFRRMVRQRQRQRQWQRKRRRRRR